MSEQRTFRRSGVGRQEEGDPPGTVPRRDGRRRALGGFVPLLTPSIRRVNAAGR
jgi:hypothetical protein